MADLRHRAIEDDDPVKRRGNDERDDRYPYGGERKTSPGKRSRTPVKAAGAQTGAPAKRPAVVSPRKAGAPSRRSSTKARPPK